MRNIVLSFVAVLGLAIVAGTPGQSQTPSLTTLVNFNTSDGAHPRASLIADANGNLFGTTMDGGAIGGGTVFEIENTGSGYANTPTILYSFCAKTDCADGLDPSGGLIADANGNLFGTTDFGGASNSGTVFEIEKTGSGYASAPAVLVSFNGANGGSPLGSLILDARDNLFGTTFAGGTSNLGTVFEIAKTASGYASTPTILVSFDGADGAYPISGLLADASGNLLGTTGNGGASDLGTVFEIAKTASGYASTPTTLVSFNDADGRLPYADLLADANGNLFGTTVGGGENSKGTVFEIEKTASGYASAPTVLVSFNRADGAYPFFYAGLIADAKGNLFGTTSGGGANDLGTVFEIVKTASGYASTPMSWSASMAPMDRCRMPA